MRFCVLNIIMFLLFVITETVLIKSQNDIILINRTNFNQDHAIENYQQLKGIYSLYSQSVIIFKCANFWKNYNIYSFELLVIKNVYIIPV